MAEVFEAAKRSPDLKSLDDTFAILTVARTEALKRLEEGQARRWEDAKEHAASLRATLELGSLEGAAEVLSVLEDALNDGLAAEAAQESAWRRVLEVERQRTQTVNVEARRMQAQQGVMPQSAALAFVYALIEAARKHVPATAHSALIADIHQLVAGANMAPAAVSTEG